MQAVSWWWSQDSKSQDVDMREISFTHSFMIMAGGIWQLLTCYWQTISEVLVTYTAVVCRVYIGEIVLYKCALENDEYTSCHSLDIGRGVDLYMGLAFWSLFQPQRWGSTCVRIDLYASIYGSRNGLSRWKYNVMTDNLNITSFSCIRDHSLRDVSEKKMKITWSYGYCYYYCLFVPFFGGVTVFERATYGMLEQVLLHNKTL